MTVHSVAPEDCCVRLDHVHNVFKYTPLGDGTIEVELVYDLDMGGLFPKFLLNLGAPYEVHKMLSEDTPKLLRREEYRNAKLAFIEEGLKTAPVPAPGPSSTSSVTRQSRPPCLAFRNAWSAVAITLLAEIPS